MAYGDGLCGGCQRIKYIVRVGFGWRCLDCKRKGK